MPTLWQCAGPAQALVREKLLTVDDGANPMQLRRGIERAVARELSAVGKSGVVSVEESPAYGLSLTLVDGIEFDHGFISPYRVTDDRMETVFEDRYILLTDKKISQVRSLSLSKGCLVIATES